MKLSTIINSQSNYFSKQFFVSHSLHLWKRDPEEDGEADDEEVSGGGQVDVLQRGEADGGDHGELDEEDARDDRPGDSDERGSHLGHHPAGQHDEGAVLDHATAHHLLEGQENRVGHTV